MKLIKVCSIIFAIIICSSSFAQAQNEVDSESATKKIKEFYIAYNTAWSANVAPKVLNRKLDSLKLKYCAITLMIELKGDGDHDALINDQYTDVQHLNTLMVTKDPTNINSYIVSYIAPTTSPTNKLIEEKVVIHLTVMKGARGIVIDSIGI